MSEQVITVRSGRWAPRQGLDRRPEPSISRFRIYGPLVLALFMLAGSRWGSWIVPGPPFVADWALALLAGAAVIDAALGRGSGRSRLDPTVAALAAAFLTWSLIRFGFGAFNLDALRDLAPYAYIVIVFLTFPCTKAQEAVASRLITIALVAHAAWVSVTLAVGRLPFAPALGTPSRSEDPVVLFDFRPDIDATVCGLLTAICLHRALVGSGRSIPVNLVLAAWGALLALSLSSRAGLIALFVQLVVIAMLGPARRRQREATARPLREPGGRPSLLQPRFVVAVLVLAMPVGLYAARDSTPVERLGNTFAPPRTSALDPPQSGGGTARARAETWSQLVAWVTDDVGRTMVGVGLGPNYLASTGISTALLGSQDASEDTRAPHNYPLGTWARLGLVGLTLYFLLLLAATRVAYLIAKASCPLRDTDLLAILITASIPVIAAIGVLMESPFGAIPFFWAVGHLSVRATQMGASRTFGDLYNLGAQKAP